MSGPPASPLRSPRRASALAIACLALACRGGDNAARASRELGPCVVAIDRASTLPPDERLLALARGCAPACSGLAAWADARSRDGLPAPSDQRRRWLDSGGADLPAESLASLSLLYGCDAMCTPEAGRAVAAAAPAERWSTLLGSCGAAPFGLSTDRADLASDTWLILQRINDWLEDLRRSAVDDSQLPAQLERATLRALFRLPLPARNTVAGYALAPSSHGRVSDAIIYVVLTADDLRVGAVPLVRLRGPQLELRPGPGGAMPGQRVDQAQLGLTVAEYAAYVERDLPQAAALPPLLIVDAGVALSRVIDVAIHIGAPLVELAVASDVALAHRCPLMPATPATAAAPVIRLGPDRIDILGLEDDRTTTRANLADELRHFAAVNAPVRLAAIELAAAAPATAADLVTILDACAAAHLDALLIGP